VLLYAYGQDHGLLHDDELLHELYVVCVKLYANGQGNDDAYGEDDDGHEDDVRLIEPPVEVVYLLVGVRQVVELKCLVIHEVARG